MGFYIGQKKEPRRSSVIITRAQGVSNGIPESVYYIIFTGLSKMLIPHRNNLKVFCPGLLVVVPGLFFNYIHLITGSPL